MRDQPDIFDLQNNLEKMAPLAERMRPRTLDEFIGQDAIVGSGSLLRRAIAADRLGSCIFYGPPGTGKTTLAHIIAENTHAAFVKLNAVTPRTPSRERTADLSAARRVPPLEQGAVGQRAPGDRAGLYNLHRFHHRKSLRFHDPRHKRTPT